MVQGLCDPGCHGAGIGIGKVLPSIHGKPLILHFSSGPKIVNTPFIGLPSAGFQDAALKDIGMSPNGLVPICRCAGAIVKIVIAIIFRIIRDQPPALHQNSANGIIGAAILLEQASQWPGTHAVLPKVIVIGSGLVLIPWQQPDAGEGLIVPVVAEAAFSLCPALFHRAVQCIAVGKGTEGIGKVSPLGMDHILRLLIGIDLIVLLEGGLAGHGIQRIGAQIDVIADLTGIVHAEAVRRIPRRVISGRQPNAADNHNGIGRLLGDCLGLLDPADGQSQGVGLRIQLAVFQLEIVVDNFQLAGIHRHIGIKVQLRLHGGFPADPLRQLQENIPCGNIFKISPRHHAQQRHQPLRHLHLLHIQRKGVGGRHGHSGLVNLIDAVQYAVLTVRDHGGIGHLPVPRQIAVPIHGGVKVKFCLVLAVERQYHGCRYGVVGRKHGGHLHIADPRSGAGRKGKSLHRPGGTVSQSDRHILRAENHGVSSTGRRQRQLRPLAIDHIHALAGKQQLIRHHHMERLASNDIPLIQQPNFHLSQL